MEIYVLASQKGGAGKTTIAIHLAAAAAAAGKSVLLCDTDPQESATAWFSIRQQPVPRVYPMDPLELELVIERERNNTDLLIVDTAPHASATAALVLRFATRVIVPIRPAFLDLHALAATDRIVRATRVPATAVLSAVPARCPEADDVATILARDYEIDVAPIRISERRAYARALGSGASVFEFARSRPAAIEMRALYDYLATTARSHATVIA